MKFFNLNLSVAGLILMVLTSLAHAGVKEAGGGDLCEDQIKIIRDDISSWIQRGGAKELSLPTGVSVAKYSEDMLAQIGKAKIRCVGQGDSEYPVRVSGTPKICRFDEGFLKKTITCDRAAFLALSETQQYVLTHHEYAGLADIERPNRDDSVYTVSNQISAYLVDQVVKRLAVRSVSNPVSSKWQELKGANGAVVSQRFQDALAQTKFPDCDIKIYEIKPNEKPHICEGQQYWLMDVSVTPKKGSSMKNESGWENLPELKDLDEASTRGVFRYPPGYFQCADEGRHEYSSELFISRDVRSGADIIRNEQYAYLLRDHKGDIINGIFESDFYMDPSYRTVKKAHFKVGVMHKKNIGLASNPQWVDEFVVIKSLTCNSTN